MDVRRIRPLVPPPYPRRNRYTPVVDANSISFASAFRPKLTHSVASPLQLANASLVYELIEIQRRSSCASSFESNPRRWFVNRVREHFGDHPFAESVRGILLFRIVTHPRGEVCYNSVNFHQVFANLTISFTGITLASTR